MTVAAIALAFAIFSIALSIIDAAQRRKDVQKHMDTAARIEAAADSINSKLTNLQQTIATESAQHAQAVQALRDLIADGSEHDTAALDAAFAKLEGAMGNIDAAAGQISAIVPDEPANTTPPSDLTEPFTGETAPAEREG